jgi:hypothetical protein
LDEAAVTFAVNSTKVGEGSSGGGRLSRAEERTLMMSVTCKEEKIQVLVAGSISRVIVTAVASICTYTDTNRQTRIWLRLHPQHHHALKLTSTTKARSEIRANFIFLMIVESRETT